MSCHRRHPFLQVLLTYKGQQLGLLEVESKWAPCKVRLVVCGGHQSEISLTEMTQPSPLPQSLQTRETLKCYKTSALEHPGDRGAG